MDCNCLVSPVYCTHIYLISHRARAVQMLSLSLAGMSVRVWQQLRHRNPCLAFFCECVVVARCSCQPLYGDAYAKSQLSISEFIFVRFWFPTKFSRSSAMPLTSVESVSFSFTQSFFSGCVWLAVLVACSAFFRAVRVVRLFAPLFCSSPIYFCLVTCFCFPPFIHFSKCFVC